MPLGGNPRKFDFWEPVISKVAKRLDGWKKAFLSRGGRLTLIQSVLSSIPIYYLSLFRARVIEAIEKLMRDFLWEGGDLLGGEHLVAWDLVCRPKLKGGLGIGKVLARNKALLMKWIWRFPKERNALWYKVIKSKYGLNPNQWDAAEADRVTFRSPWKAISSLYEDFFQHVFFRIGSGTKIRFWEDHWVGDGSLQRDFPSLYRLSLFKNRPISEFYGDQGWSFHFMRNLRDRVVPQKVELINRLASIRLCSNIEDRRVWAEDTSGSFSCKSAFVCLSYDIRGTELLVAKFFWKTPTPSKVKVFTWLIALGKLNVHDVLQKRDHTTYYLRAGVSFEKGLRVK